MTSEPARIAALAAALCACHASPELPPQVAAGPAPTHGRGDERPRPRPPEVLVELPLTYDVIARKVHCPMVEVGFGRARTKLILDTGSTDHVLTIELARRVGLNADPTEPGTDHAGAPVPSWKLGEVLVRFADVDLRLRDAVAIEGPAPFEGWGVGGFLSPQSLHPTAFVVMDLAGNRLTIVDTDPAGIEAWLVERYPSLRALALPRGQDPRVSLQAAIAPFPPVEAVLNTGGKGTEFARSAVPGLRGQSPEALGRGVSGAEVEGEALPGQTLRIADATFPIPALLVREKMLPPPGLVGMDVLRGTVLVVSADRTRPTIWLVP